MLRGHRSRFYADKDLALKIAEHYFNCNFSLSYEAGDGSVDLDIEWDITDKRVQKIDIEADEDAENMMHARTMIAPSRQTSA